MTASPLTNVRRFVIPDLVLDPTLAFLQKTGRRGDEGFVVWGGVLDPSIGQFGKDAIGDGPVGRTVRFTSAYVPQQQAHGTPEGLLVTVDGTALFRMNRDLYARGEIAAGQVHTHPTEAFHSETDDHFPLVTLMGALSIVVPNFAREGRADMSNWAWYRLVGVGEWAVLTGQDKIELDRGA